MIYTLSLLFLPSFIMCVVDANECIYRICLQSSGFLFSLFCLVVFCCFVYSIIFFFIRCWLIVFFSGLNSKYNSTDSFQVNYSFSIFLFLSNIEYFSLNIKFLFFSDQLQFIDYKLMIFFVSGMEQIFLAKINQNEETLPKEIHHQK